MDEPILFIITKEESYEILNNSIEDNHDIFYLNFENTNEDEVNNKLKNIFEILSTEEKTTYLLFSNLNDSILENKEFLTLYHYSTALNVKLFSIK